MNFIYTHASALPKHLFIFHACVYECTSPSVTLRRGTTCCELAIAIRDVVAGRWNCASLRVAYRLHVYDQERGEGVREHLARVKLSFKGGPLRFK